MYTILPLVESKKTEELKESKEPNKKVDKYNGFKVPSNFSRTLRWCNHIYTIIKEARQELLKRDDVRTAFNNLVDCLAKYEGSYISVRITQHMKYYSHIRIKSTDPLFLTHILHYDDDDWDMEPGWWCKKEDFHSDEGLLKIQASRTDIMNTYAILYELIKRDVIPYMEIKFHQQVNERMSKYYRYRMKALESVIKTAEDKITKTQEKMVLYSQQYEELQIPPKLTVFD